MEGKSHNPEEFISEDLWHYRSYIHELGFSAQDTELLNRLPVSKPRGTLMITLDADTHEVIEVGPDQTELEIINNVSEKLEYLDDLKAAKAILPNSPPATISISFIPAPPKTYH